MDANKPGFTLNQRRSRRNPAVKISDLDFADDIDLILNQIEEAQTTLVNIENAAARMGPRLSTDKTEKSK